MSSTPIFDATLADAPRNIWQASPIFPRPPAKETLEDSLRRIGHPRFATPPLQPEFTDWSAIKLGGDA